MPETVSDPFGLSLPAQRRRWLIGAIVAAAAVAFVADLLTDRLLAYGVAYLPLICIAAFLRDPRAVWWMAGVTTAMVVMGFFLPYVSDDLAASLGNRVLSLVAIATTATLVRYERYVRDNLIEQRRRAEAAERTQTQLLSNLSHELRTPLNAVLGFSELLLADCRADQKSALTHISASGKRLLRTLENLIELSRFDERQLRPQETDLARLLRQLTEAAQPEAAEQEVALSFTAEPARLAVTTDLPALRRILDNVLDNAIKFTGPGGVVAVTARGTNEAVTARGTNEAVTARGMQDVITVTVRDSGIGMRQDVIDQLGAPFFQGEGGKARRFEGLGTGLALSVRLAAAMGAQLSFESTPAQGTTVCLRLPATAPAPGSATPGSATPGSATTGSATTGAATTGAATTGAANIRAASGVDD